MMHNIIKAIYKAWRVGGWAPLFVFAAHEVLTHGFNAYKAWPHIDIPFHFAGGLAMAFFISGCYQSLPRDETDRRRTVILELILTGSLTATVAVFWEFAEFTMDQIFGTNIQVSLSNTMQDMALGLLGAGLFIGFRAVKLRAGKADIFDLARDWINFRNGPLGLQ